MQRKDKVLFSFICMFVIQSLNKNIVRQVLDFHLMATTATIKRKKKSSANEQ